MLTRLLTFLASSLALALLVLGALSLAAAPSPARFAAPGPSPTGTQFQFAYLPLALFEYVPPTATPIPPTATATSVPPTNTSVPPTATFTSVPPTATFTSIPPTATATGVPPANIQITFIFFDGAGATEPDEYVEIQNQGAGAVNLSGWTLRDNASTVFTFPAYTIQPNQTCRVYTNQLHAQWCSFTYGSGNAIWNNGGDCAFLRNNLGVTVDTYCY